MCKPASYIVFKDKLFTGTMSESHEDIIKEHKLNMDGVGGPNGVRCEISPENNDYTKLLQDWIFRVDQDQVPEWFDKDEVETRVRADLGRWYLEKIITGCRDEVRGAHINRVHGSAIINFVRDSARIDCVQDSARIDWVQDSASINCVRDSARINCVQDSARIDCVQDSARIKQVQDSARIKQVQESAYIECVQDSAHIDCVAGRAHIDYVRDSSIIDYVTGSAIIYCVRDSAHINYVTGYACIEYVVGSASIGYVAGLLVRFFNKFQSRIAGNTTIVADITTSPITLYLGTEEEREITNN
jgi:hypothetical protein